MRAGDDLGAAAGATESAASVRVGDHVEGWDAMGPGCGSLAPWEVTARLPDLIRALVPAGEEIAVHEGATVEEGAVVKGPAVIGPGCLVAAAAYLRSGVWMGEGCIVGPAVELKTVVMGAGAKVAHLSFAGDAILDRRVDVEAGAMIADHRNERDGAPIRIAAPGGVVETGVDEFGALVGDGARIGANAVVAPGAVLARGRVVPRLALVDHWPTDGPSGGIGDD